MYDGVYFGTYGTYTYGVTVGTYSYLLRCGDTVFTGDTCSTVVVSGTVVSGTVVSGTVVGKTVFSLVGDKVTGL